MKEILNQVLHSKPHVHIGKSGLTDAVIDQISKQFRNRKIIKVRFLSMGEFNTMREATKVLSEKSNSKILDVRGNTCVILDLTKRI